jgi:hypothetical protein
MMLPNFLIVGAIKSGTTSLYHYLMQHPDVFLATDVKESRFLVGLSPEKNPEIVDAIPHIKNFDTYQRLFVQAMPQQVVGEVDPWCLYLYEQTIPRIKTFLDPIVRIVMCLRNPVDRCYSHYYQVVKQGWETRPFAETIEAGLAGAATTWYERAFIETGLYYEQVKAYKDAFPPDQVLVFLFEDLQADRLEMFQHLCRFIGVDDTFRPNLSERVNVGGVPKNRLLHNLLKRRWLITTLMKPFFPVVWRKSIRQRLITQNLRPYPPMADNERQRLVDYYRKDILELQSLINKDLSDWLV